MLLLALAPLGLLAWLGSHLVTAERSTVEHSFHKLQQDKLAGVAAVIDKVMARREQRLVKLGSNLPLTAASLRATVRNQPWIGQIFLIDRDGRLLHPPPAGPLSSAESDFIGRIGQLLEDRSVFSATRDELSSNPQGQLPPSADHGWYTWYWGSGLNFILWQRVATGRILGFELDRYRLIADIISELPAGKPSAGKDARLALIDSRDRVLYQWGGYQPGQQQAPVARLVLDGPLKPWRLLIYTAGLPAAGPLGVGADFFVVLGLSALGLALLGLAIYFYRESARELRDAGQRVSFVNHVSHELKTPLTNIRMYAELLQERIGPDDQRARHQIDVVVGESQRLSRLIDNVLTFSRHRRGTLKLHRQSGVVDEIIGRLLEHSARALSDKNIEFDFERGAPRRVLVDEDLLQQIMNNLLTNVEKYAPGGPVTIRTGQTESHTTISVADSGPGVPEAFRQRVFEPFYRLGSGLSEGAAGTGIGLSIARELARLHGGELRLLAGQSGAVFEVSLATDRESADESADRRG